MHMFIHMEKVQKLFSGQEATYMAVDVRIKRVDPARQQQLLGVWTILLTHVFVIEH